LAAEAEEPVIQMGRLVARAVAVEMGQGLEAQVQLAKVLLEEPLEE
jgi:hypothetical protein